MGGSSLAPEVIAKAYQKDLTVLDTTDPEQIAQVLNTDLSSSVIIISSKSGSTIETLSQKLLFEKNLRAANLEPKNHLIIITDPNSPLDIAAKESGYRVMNADPMVGGRFSALSAFGLLPAALLGIDVSVLLDDADRASKTFSQPESAAIKLATILSEETSQCFALTDSGSNVPGISDWIEQLVAESTGKDAKGRLPVVIEGSSTPLPTNLPTISFAQDSSDLNVLGTLGEQFILWEWVTALLCRTLDVNPFNQPNVTEVKERTSDLLNLWKGS
jgi:glucose-6-phosphate isomerase